MNPGRLVVLYDSHCPICRQARAWLSNQPQLVTLDFEEAGSEAARRRFPGLDHDATLRDITVVADTGAVYTNDAAWLICLWALDSYRSLSVHLGQPHLRGAAREVVAMASAVRARFREDGGCETAA